MTPTKIKYLAAVMSLSAVLTASATDVSVPSPGTLEKTMTANSLDPATLTQLSVTGAINAADLYFLGHNATGLKDLDLSKATISAYSGDKSINGLKDYAAGLIPPGTFAGTNIETIKLPAEKTAIGAMAFASSAIKQLPDLTYVTSIDDGAFSGCHSLTAITYPAGIETGRYVFSGSALKEVLFTSATAVPTGTFKDCTALATVTGSDNINAVGDDAFNGCTSLSHFTFGPALTTIGKSAFYKSGLAELDLNSCGTLKKIDDFAFSANEALTCAYLENTKTEIGVGIFFDDTALTEVRLPDSMEDLTLYLFKNTPSLRMEKLPESLRYISEYSLLGNKAITEIKLPSAVYYIGDAAMEGMSGLTKIDAGTITKVPMLGKDVWKGVNQPAVLLVVPDANVNDYRDASQWCEFNINTVTGTESIESDITPRPSVKARFEGNTLVLQAIAVNISDVSLTDISGRLLLSRRIEDDNARIDTSEFNNPYFIVTVTLRNGTRTSLKLKR